MKDLANIPNPKIEYVGGIVIHAKDPTALAAWYTNTFGFETRMEHEGGYYGGFRAPWGELHFGIVPAEGNVDYKSNISITFRVSDFDAYLEQLKQHDLDPRETTEDQEGRFAEFVDPEGNRISIWGVDDVDGRSALSSGPCTDAGPRWFVGWSVRVRRSRVETYV